MRPLQCLLGLAAAGLWISAAMAQSTPPQEHPTIAGWTETVTFPDYGIAMDAKLDTGADSSSLGVSNLDRFKRSGKVWYRFTFTGKDGKSVTLEQQTNRTARVMRAEVEDVRRPIVHLKICLAGHEAETDFTLTDRSERRTSLLIGRRFLASRILVDSDRTHLFPEKCEGGK